MKNIATTKSGIEYFIVERDEEAGVAWGVSIRDGKTFGAIRRLKLANLTFIGTATRDQDRNVRHAVAPTNAPSTAFAMEMPALYGDVVTQRHADYCAENGHATHTNDSVVSPWCPRCGGSLSDGRETGGIVRALPSANDRAAASEAPDQVAAEPVFVVTSSAPGEIALTPEIEAALVAMHADFSADATIADDYLTAAGAKFRVHLRPEGEGVAAFWTDGGGREWRVEFPDADRNMTELVAFEWQDLVDEFGKPVIVNGEKFGGRWHSSSMLTRRARIAVERATA